MICANVMVKWLQCSVAQKPTREKGPNWQTYIQQRRATCYLQCFQFSERIEIHSAAAEMLPQSLLHIADKKDELWKVRTSPIELLTRNLLSMQHIFAFNEDEICITLLIFLHKIISSPMNILQVAFCKHRRKGSTKRGLHQMKAAYKSKQPHYYCKLS